MIKRRLALLALEGVLLLTACGQAKDNSALTMPPLDAVQSAAQVIESAGDNAQEDTANLPAEETAEEATPAGGEDTPKPAEDIHHDRSGGDIGGHALRICQRSFRTGKLRRKPILCLQQLRKHVRHRFTDGMPV